MLSRFGHDGILGGLVEDVSRGVPCAGEREEHQPVRDAIIALGRDVERSEAYLQIVPRAIEEVHDWVYISLGEGEFLKFRILAIYGLPIFDVEPSPQVGFEPSG